MKAVEPAVRPFDRSEYLSGLRTVAAKYAALLRVDGPQETTRAALKRLGISRLTATPRPGSKLWDISGRLDLAKALAEVHAEPEGNDDRTTWEDLRAGWLEEAEVEATPVGCLEERAG